ncbi:dienelactone hydrolase family protein [Ottowia sp.]|uniref:dienelactone hydrolase family protein n=1 Tax=Ottowia sp. TaxID=1898956 RepID=UPI002639187B|nr:dienelactone hydrolase family protein [Ottowia sp.]
MSNDSLSYSALGRTYTCRRLPTAHPPRAGIILLPDWRGAGPLAMQHAQHLHGLGCDVVVADLYGDGFMPSHPDQVGPMVQQLLAHRQDGVVSLTACLNAFRPLLPADTPVIVLGYSAGGMVALDLARSGATVDGTITCSALLKTADAGMPTRIPGPVLILQGTQDVISPPDVISTVIAEMDAAGNDARFVLFSQTHHAFDNPDAGTDPSARLVYSAASAARARVAIEAFVNEIAP